MASLKSIFAQKRTLTTRAAQIEAEKTLAAKREYDYAMRWNLGLNDYQLELQLERNMSAGYYNTANMSYALQGTTDEEAKTLLEHPFNIKVAIATMNMQEAMDEARREMKQQSKVIRDNRTITEIAIDAFKYGTRAEKSEHEIYETLVQSADSKMITQWLQQNAIYNLKGVKETLQSIPVYTDKANKGKLWGLVTISRNLANTILKIEYNGHVSHAYNNDLTILYSSGSFVSRFAIDAQQTTKIDRDVKTFMHLIYA